MGVLLRVIVDRTDLVAAWVSQQIGLSFIPPYTAIGFEDNGSVHGGVVFLSYTGQDVEIAMAGLWSRPMLRVIGNYAFGVLRCHRMTARCRASHEKVASVIRLAGFKREGLARAYYPDKEDAILFGMLDTECRWR